MPPSSHISSPSDGPVQHEVTHSEWSLLCDLHTNSRNSTKIDFMNSKVGLQIRQSKQVQHCMSTMKCRKECILCNFQTSNTCSGCSIKNKDGNVVLMPICTKKRYGAYKTCWEKFHSAVKLMRIGPSIPVFASSPATTTRKRKYITPNKTSLTKLKKKISRSYGK